MTRDEAREAVRATLDLRGQGADAATDRFVEAMRALLLSRQPLPSVFCEDPSEARDPNGGHAL